MRFCNNGHLVIENGYASSQLFLTRHSLLSQNFKHASFEIRDSEGGNLTMNYIKKITQGSKVFTFLDNM